MKPVLPVIIGLLLITGCGSKEPPCFKPGERWFIAERDSPTANKPPIPDCSPTPEEITRREEAEAKLNAYMAIFAREFLAPRPVSSDEAQKIDRIVAFVRDALRAGKASRITVEREFLASEWKISLASGLAGLGKEVCFWPPDFKPVSCLYPRRDTVDPRGPKGSGR